MDDLRIFASSQKEIEVILIEIDKHLKSQGLCINSKKTIIQELDSNRENEKLTLSSILEYFRIREKPAARKSSSSILSNYSCCLRSSWPTSLSLTLIKRFKEKKK